MKKISEVPVIQLIKELAAGLIMATVGGKYIVWPLHLTIPEKPIKIYRSFYSL